MNKKIFIFILIGVLAASIPLTLFWMQRPQETRTRASASTSLSFTPISTIDNPIKKIMGDPVSIDIIVEPGSNLVSFVKFQIKFDPTKIALTRMNPFVLNTDAFPVTIEDPIITNDTLTASVSIGSDPAKTIKTTTRLGTLNFNSLEITNDTPTQITYTAITQTLSAGSNEQAGENTLSTTSPANIVIINKTSPCNPYGDVDNDGYITKNDAELVLKYAVGSIIPTAEQKRRADVDIDGIILAQDALWISRYVEGKTTTFPVCNAPTPKPTATPTPTPKPTATPTPTPKPTATPTPADTLLDITVYQHGIWNSGDNTNPAGTSLSNKNPVHSTIKADLEIFNTGNKLVGQGNGSIIYNNTKGNYQGTINISPGTLSSGNYYLKIKTATHLKRLVPGIITITAGQKNTIPAATLVTGDSDNNNMLNILDYNSLLGCYSDLTAAKACNADKKVSTDFNDDSFVNQVDYNLFLRELATQLGE